eukprot:scaffold9917_cov99-Skeletonema_marinoi.AAC.3
MHISYQAGRWFLVGALCSVEFYDNSVSGVGSLSSIKMLSLWVIGTPRKEIKRWASQLTSRGRYQEDMDWGLNPPF